MNIAKGENGTCNGDSGGPIFYEDPTLGRVQVSLVSGGDAPCQSNEHGSGFSSPEAFDFIACGMVEGDVSAVVACRWPLRTVGADDTEPTSQVSGDDQSQPGPPQVPVLGW